MVTIFSLIEPELALEIQCHGLENGRVVDVKASNNLRHIFTIGTDGYLKRWDWKYSTQGRRAASEYNENAERIEVDLGYQIKEFREKLPATRNQQKLDINESPNEVMPHEKEESPNQKEDITISAEKMMFGNLIGKKIKAISERIMDMMKENAKAGELERIDRSEFVIDLAERGRLLSNIENKLQKIRNQQELENLKQKVLKNRIMV